MSIRCGQCWAEAKVEIDHEHGLIDSWCPHCLTGARFEPATELKRTEWQVTMTSEKRDDSVIRRRTPEEAITYLASRLALLELAVKQLVDEGGDDDE